MNNALLVVSILAVLAMLVALSYESMADYYLHMAIKTVKLENNPSTPHLDLLHLEKEVPVIPFRNFEWDRKDDTMTVTFGGGKSFSEHFGDIPEFSYAHTFHANQTFAWRCIERADHTHLGFYKYLGSDIIYGDRVLLLWHYEGQTRYPMPCIYPDLIIDSIDLVDYDYASILEMMSKIELTSHKNLAIMNVTHGPSGRSGD